MSGLLVLCSFLSIVSMDTPKPACLHQDFVVVMDYERVVCLYDSKRPGQLHLPGGIVASNQPGIEIVRKYLQEQTGISITTDLLAFIAQSTRFNAHKQKLLEQSYYLIENRRLQPSKEDSDDLYTIWKSVDELAEAKEYFPRDHSQSSLKVGTLLQKVAQHIKSGCPEYSEQQLLENINEPDCKTQLELFPKKNSQ